MDRLMARVGLESLNGEFGTALIWLTPDCLHTGLLEMEEVVVG